MGKQIVNVPSFMVRVDSQKHIDFALNSPFGGGRPGRVKRRNLKYDSLILMPRAYMCNASGGMQPPPSRDVPS